VVEARAGAKGSASATGRLYRPPRSYSEYTASTRPLIKLRRAVFEQGAAFPLQGMTAHYLLHDFANRKGRWSWYTLRQAEWLLLVQWLKHLGPGSSEGLHGGEGVAAKKAAPNT